MALNGELTLLPMLPTTINEVIAALAEIIARTRAENSPMGYFAALYHTVTVRVKEGIVRGEFQDGPRMERLDVIFANRYLEAYAQYQRGETPTQSWQRAFEASDDYWPIVLQHLLLGMNAHISLDLGIAAAQTSPGAEIGSLQADFNRINEVLAELVSGVEQDLAHIWPTLKLLLKLSGKVDNFLVDFSMSKARDGAWKFATQLAALPPEAQADAIARRDQKVAKISGLVLHPGLPARLVFGVIRLGERGTVATRIARLETN